MLLRRYHKIEVEKVPFDDVSNEEETNLEPINTPLQNQPHLEELTIKELKQVALERQIEVPKKIKKAELIQLIREG